MLSIMPALKDAEGRVTTTLKDKEVMMRGAAFHPLHPIPEDPIGSVLSRKGTAHRRVILGAVHRTLHDQEQI